MGKILAIEVCHWKEWEILDDIRIKIMAFGFEKLNIWPIEKHKSICHKHQHATLNATKQQVKGYKHAQN